MRVAVTGTPGTGKTTATDRLAGGTADGPVAKGEPAADVDVIHLNDVIREQGFAEGTDAERDSLIADLDAVAEWVDANAGTDEGDTTQTTVVESHLAHHLPAGRVVVLRCRPERLESRLCERGESDASAGENAESEALDVILSEAVETHGRERVYEIDTTERAPEAVAGDIAAVVAGEREPSAGTVSFVEYLQP